jgi:Cu2+-exporting ATPase
LIFNAARLQLTSMLQLTSCYCHLLLLPLLLLLLLLTHPPGTPVTAGTLNCDGSLMVSAEASGQDTVIADIVRLVEAAQAHTAPIQRLADTVAGKFAYGVMGLSAATFTFWSTVGCRMFPQVLAAGGLGAAAAAGSSSTAAAAAAAACCGPPAAAAAGAGAAAVSAAPAAAAVLLGLQLACNVLVVACPCALGLATPTAVLVGTAAGARKGLLVRGGDILEATSQVTDGHESSREGLRGLLDGGVVDVFGAPSVGFFMGQDVRLLC